MNRRAFLSRCGLGTAAGLTARSLPLRGQTSSILVQREPAYRDLWERVRSQFDLSPEFIHASALFISSHPLPVREAIERYRRMLDATPVVAVLRENHRRQRDARQSAARYLGVKADEIALTDSTTMGLGLVYTGLKLSRGQEILTTEHDYYATHESIRLAAQRTGASVRRIALYRSIASTSTDEIVRSIRRSIQKSTRVLALTWVHSGTGLKLPVGRIAEVVARANQSRRASDRILLCVDGVHGFGVEDVTMKMLGCDFFVAGCHKWLFGPRGTGIVWGRPEAWSAVVPTIPSFTDTGSRLAWMNDAPPSGPTTSSRVAPGGFKSFEHQWALSTAFTFHGEIGKDRVAARTHELARQLKEGLSQSKNIVLHTPMSDELSAGIVCFSIREMNPYAAVNRLRKRRIVATTTPYAQRYVRLAPSIRNSPEEMEMVIREVRGLRG
jgi:isopenicillin-N epimerase